MRNPSPLVPMLRIFFIIPSFRSLFISATAKSCERERIEAENIFFCFISRLLLPFNHIQNFQCSFFTLLHADSLVWSFYCCSFHLSHFSLPLSSPISDDFDARMWTRVSRFFHDLANSTPLKDMIKPKLHERMPGISKTDMNNCRREKRSDKMRNLQRLNFDQKFILNFRFLTGNVNFSIESQIHSTFILLIDSTSVIVLPLTMKITN